VARFALPIFSPGWRALDDNRNFVASGKLQFFDALDDPLEVFSNAALSTSLGVEVNLNPAAYPITSGNAKTLIYTDADTLRVVCLNDEDVEVWEHEGVAGSLDLAPFDATLATPQYAIGSSGTNVVVVAGDAGKLFSIDCSGGNRTATLPLAADVEPGVPFGFQHIGSGNTVTINAVGSDEIVTPGDLVAVSVTISVKGELVWLASDGVNWKLIGNTLKSADLVKSEHLIGCVVDFAGTTPPSKWLLCYGQAVSRTTYALLFAAIGTTFGVGDGSTTFNLPDCRGRVVAGKDDMGGSSADRLTNQSGGLNGDTLGATGGSEVHTLTAAQLAAHTHTEPGGHGTNSATTAFRGSDSTAYTITSSSAGSDSAHNNVQPTIIFNKMIFAGV